jgi:cytidine deaminase
MIKKFEFEYQLFQDDTQIEAQDLNLLQQARNATANAFAPFSHFLVGAAAILSNGEIVIGANQESNSFPVGICAERALLNSIGSQYPRETIKTMAISYHPIGKDSNEPISPCGMCRQSLLDYEMRFKAPIRVILAGMHGEVMILPTATQLLPFGFNGEILQGLGKK